MRWSVEEYFKAHTTDYKKSLEISHWDAFFHMKELLEYPMSNSLNLELDKHVAVGKTLKHWTKLLDWLRSIGPGFGEGMESRTIMVPANGWPTS